MKSKNNERKQILTWFHALLFTQDISEVVWCISARPLVELAVFEHFGSPIFTGHIGVIYRLHVEIQEAGYKYLGDVETHLPTNNVGVDLVEFVCTYVNPCFRDRVCVNMDGYDLYPAHQEITADYTTIDSHWKGRNSMAKIGLFI